MEISNHTFFIIIIIILNLSDRVSHGIYNLHGSFQQCTGQKFLILWCRGWCIGLASFLFFLASFLFSFFFLFLRVFLLLFFFSFFHFLKKKKNKKIKKTQTKKKEKPTENLNPRTRGISTDWYSLTWSNWTAKPVWQYRLQHSHPSGSFSVNGAFFRNKKMIHRPYASKSPQKTTHK